MGRASQKSSHEIIVNDEHVYAVWPAGRALPSGGQFNGKGGPEAERRAYLRVWCVETRATPMRLADGRPPASRWG
jgi:uncharacterized protein YbdZ (MbtH family)